MSVTTQQQCQSRQGTKVYVVDPEQLRQKVILKSFQVGKSSPQEVAKVSVVKELRRTFAERRPRKRRLKSEEADSCDDEDDVLYTKIETKEVTTRAGRVSKAKQPGVQPKVAKALEVGPKIKKREPANVFRCPKCRKVYIGYTKLKLHFRKFPDHCNYGDDISKDLNTKLRKLPESSTTETQTELIVENLVDAAVQTSAGEGSNHESVSASKPNQNFSFQLLLNGPHFVTPSSSNPTLPLCAQSSGTTTTLSRPSNSFSNFNSFKNSDLTSTLGGSTGTGNHSDCASDPVFDPLLPPSGVANHNGYAHQTSTKQTNTSVLLSPTIVKNINNHHSDHTHAQSVGLSLQKLLWDVVEEKMLQHGINQILADLSDVAEKLAKIARDKIIPIREEEEEQLRVNNTAPIVQVC
ncbi:unnamed protein product [Allacma fusca]|uniref:Uncharacterized protein n=1 Tax=Allacma fusca TaxID=39272 RepID=A0A8J2MDB7_9HEXA|nr:unnamed protein product [Allacma fusca]